MAIILDIGQNGTKLGIKIVCLRLEKVKLSLRPQSSGETALGVHPPGEKQLLVSMRTPALFLFRHNCIYFLKYVPTPAYWPSELLIMDHLLQVLTRRHTSRASTHMLLSPTITLSQLQPSSPSQSTRLHTYEHLFIFTHRNL